MEERNEESALVLKRWSDAVDGGRIMGRPYSTDLRERVLRACENGEESQAEIARRFEISESAVGSWLRQLHKDGRRAPKPHGRGFRSILDEDDGAVLRSLVREIPSARARTTGSRKYGEATGDRSREPRSIRRRSQGGRVLTGDPIPCKRLIRTAFRHHRESRPGSGQHVGQLLSLTCGAAIATATASRRR